MVVGALCRNFGGKARTNDELDTITESYDWTKGHKVVQSSTVIRLEEFELSGTSAAAGSCLDSLCSSSLPAFRLRTFSGTMIGIEGAVDKQVRRGKRIVGHSFDCHPCVLTAPSGHFSSCTKGPGHPSEKKFASSYSQQVRSDGSKGTSFYLI